MSEIDSDLQSRIPKNGDSVYCERDLDRRLDLAFQTKQWPIMVGPTGTGKTRAAEHLAGVKSLPFFLLSCNSDTAIKRNIGKNSLQKGDLVFVEGMLTKFIQSPSVVLFDEINAISPEKGFDLHELFNNGSMFVMDADGNKGKYYTKHPDCFLAAACNPSGGRYVGTNRMNIALADRCVQIWFSEFTDKEILSIIEKSFKSESVSEITPNLIKFYKDVREFIRGNQTRVEFSLRKVLQIIRVYDVCKDITTALEMGFLDYTRLVSGTDETEAFANLAYTHFPGFKKRKET